MNRIRRTTTTVLTAATMSIAVATTAAISGCASAPDHGAGAPHVVGIASPAQASMLERMKSLEGEWTTLAAETGNVVTVSVFEVTAGGSAVRETMFPGTSHEMTNLYHMDGPSLLLTHYCAAGNQPRMRAVAANGNKFPFRFDAVTNLTAADEMYMGNMTLEFVDANTVIEHWETVRDGKTLTEHSPTLVLTRKQ